MGGLYGYKCDDRHATRYPAPRARCFGNARPRFGGGDQLLGHSGKGRRPAHSNVQRGARRRCQVSKLAPYPTRFSSNSFLEALKASLTRLDTHTVDLYLIHFPFYSRADSVLVYGSVTPHCTQWVQVCPSACVGHPDCLLTLDADSASGFPLKARGNDGVA